MVALKVSVFLALLGVCLAAAQLETQIRAEGEFNTVYACAPLNVLVTPGDKYQLEVTAEKPVIDAITSRVTSGVLYIGIDRVKSEEDIKVTVTLPNSKLKHVQLSAAATLFIAPGFTAKEFIASGNGASNLYAEDIAVDKLTLDSSGASTMEVRGSIGSANMKANGAADISLAKVEGPVQVNANGASDIFVEAHPASAESMIITGTAQGASQVGHAGGKCELSEIWGASECKQVAGHTFTMKPAGWSHGVDVTGASSCNGPPGGNAVVSP